MKFNRYKTHLFTTPLFCLITAVAIGRVHLSITTTLVGYNIGKLKETESNLQDNVDKLTAQLNQLTTKNYLEFLGSRDGNEKTSNSISLSSN